MLLMALAAVTAATRAIDLPAAWPTADPMLVIDGNEGKPIDDGVVLIAGERIAAIGSRGQMTIPPGTPRIDTRGMSVLPRLADMHVHLMILGHGDYLHRVPT